MAWELTNYVVEGELYNTRFGVITGWLKLVGLQQLLTLELAGNFCRDIRGARIRVTGSPVESVPDHRFFGLALRQVGTAGDITAGHAPFHSDSACIEWYSYWNGRVWIWLLPEQVDLIGQPRRSWEPELAEIIRLRPKASTHTGF